MRVYLIAAPEDEAEADKLAAYLKRFGVFIRSEYGRMAYPPAQHGEMTLALWSRNAMMSSRQMMLTNRAIDAWSEGQLVMARLEHGLNPRGLGDLKMIDLTFEAAREHRYHDVLNAIRALEDERRRALAAPPAEPEPETGSGPSGLGKKMREAQEAAVPGVGDNSIPDASPAPARKRRAKSGIASRDSVTLSADKSSAGGGLLGFLLIVLVAGGFGAAIWQGLLTVQQAAIYGGGGIAGILVIGLIFLAISSLLKPKSKGPLRASRIEAMAGETPETEEVAAAAPAPEPLDDAHDVFVSYSHQNAETVLPIVSSVEASGVSIWIDRDELRAGDNWAAQIVRAIKASGRFCLMCSEQAFASDHVRREVYLADKYGKDMLPVRLDAADMPEDIEYFLIGRQWIDLTTLPEDERVSAIEAVLAGGAA